MEKSLVCPVVRCEETNASQFRPDTQGRGIWLWCKGHHKEELKTWKQLGLTRAIVEQLLQQQEL